MLILTAKDDGDMLRPAYVSAALAVNSFVIEKVKFRNAAKIIQKCKKNCFNVILPQFRFGCSRTGESTNFRISVWCKQTRTLYHPVYVDMVCSPMIFAGRLEIRATGKSKLVVQKRPYRSIFPKQQHCNRLCEQTSRIASGSSSLSINAGARDA